MTREEGIEQTAYRYAVKRQEDPNYPVYNWETEISDAFIAGTEWADQNPANYDGKAMLHVLNKGHEQGYKDAIDKACEWLKYNFNMPDDFEFHFRKAMEEQQ